MMPGLFLMGAVSCVFLVLSCLVVEVFFPIARGKTGASWAQRAAAVFLIAAIACMWGFVISLILGGAS